MDDLIEKLHRLGFSEYESKAYIALLANNPVTGYEISKQSGVPRSMIYQSLQRLINKGAVMTIMGQPIKYMPVTPAELLGGLQTNYNQLIENLCHELEEYQKPADLGYFWNIKGYDQIIEKVRLMISTTQNSLYLSAFSEEIMPVAGELTALYNKGCKIELLARGEIDLPIQTIYPYIERAAVDEKHPGRWLTIISDDNEVLIAEGLQDPQCIGVWTRNVSLITVSLRYIKYEMFIAQKFNQIQTWSE